MKSIRSWLLIAIPFFASVAMVSTELRRSTNSTTDWRDLAVSGRGYIHVVDENGENSIWLRYARLAINSNGLLCATVDGKLRPLEPQITVPSDWTRIDIDTNGRITVNTSGSAGISIGTLYLTTFYGEELGDPISISNEEDRLGPPVVNEPGSSGAGFLMQRTSLVFTIPLTQRTLVVLSFAVIWLSGGLWYTRNNRMP